MTPDITLDHRDGVLTLTLDRPDKKNALTDPMYEVLANAVERAETDPDVRVLVIRASGDTFCAGNDLQTFRDYGADADPAPIADRAVGRFLHALAVSTTPIVAAVQGKAVGVGMTLLLHCDHLLMAEGSQLMAPFVDLALVPEAGSTTLLAERVGHARAFAMLGLGEPLPAEAAVAAGVANAVVPAADLHAAAQEVAERLAAKPAVSLRATKRLMRDSERLLRQIDAELVVFDERLRSPEAQAMFAAFAAKGESGSRPAS